MRASEPDAGADGGAERGITVAAGELHACAVLADASVVCWGGNDSGQLGDGTATDSPVPVQVRGIGGIDSLDGMTEVAAGPAHACARAAGRTVVCWGRNETGELGNGSTMNSLVPVAVHGVGGPGTLDTVAVLSVGQEYGCAALEDETAACWGGNHVGQLGDGTTTPRLVPTPVTNEEGTDRLRDVINIDGLNVHSCAVLSHAGVTCWGYNGHGRLGDGTTTDSEVPIVVSNDDASAPLTGVEQVATGGGHSCARMGDGTVFCWGSNEFGQLGDGTTSPSSLPVRVKGVGATGVLSNVARIDAGPSFTCALLESQEIVCWGFNVFGHLGDGTTTPRSTPVYVTDVGGGGRLSGVTDFSVNGFGCAVLEGERVACWGRSPAGLGDGTTTESHHPVLVALP